MERWLTGQFLIAGKRLHDSNFYRSVVLMVEHNPNGAMGLVINHPSEVTVAQALEGHFDLPETGALVYTGGPVESGALFILHNSPEFDGAESPVVQGLYVGSSAEVFEEIVRSAEAGHPELKFRVFAGCSGWSGGQLEGELSRGDWLTVPATTDYIFDEEPYEVWGRLMRSLVPPDFQGEAPPNAEWN